MRNHLVLLCLCISGMLSGQSSLPEFGIFNQGEIEIKECAFDKNAGAVILLHEAVADHDEEWRLLTKHRVRIKILHQRETERANIRIPFYSRDKFEFITKIRGLTYNVENGNPVVSYLENKSIFTEKIDNYRSAVKFAMPNAKPGSIIEYEYTSVMAHYGGLEEWVFQDEIPTAKSSFLLTILPTTEFQYSLQKKSEYPVVIKPMPEEGKIYFEMNNIPGLRFEPYMDAPRDYIQKVEFQLASVTSRSSGTRKINQTWKDLAFDLSTQREFGGALKKNVKIEELQPLIANLSSAAGKLEAIYNFIRGHFTWNGYYSKFVDDGFKNILSKRNGNTGEINLLLINLLLANDIETYPMLIAERDYGKIDTTYPFLDRFNKVAAYAVVDGKTYILDATEKYNPPGLVPYPVLNTIGFIVDRKAHKLVRLISDKDAFTNSIRLEASVDKLGLMNGKALVSSKGYARQINVKGIREDEKKYVKQLIDEAGNGLVAGAFSYENLENENQPLEQKVEFSVDLNAGGGFVLVPVNLFTGIVKNPFTAEQRFTNVNFGYPYDITLEATFTLPEKSTIEKMPSNKTLTLGNKSFIASRMIKFENGQLKVTITFQQTTTIIPNNQYSSLRYIFKELTNFLNEQVLVKLPG